MQFVGEPIKLLIVRRTLANIVLQICTNNIISAFSAAELHQTQNTDVRGIFEMKDTTVTLGSGTGADWMPFSILLLSLILY